LFPILAAEYRNVYAKSIDVDEYLKNSSDLVEIILGEMIYDDAVGEICYRSGSRYVTRLKPLLLDTSPKEQPGL
jgi:hypothetical protein